MTPDTEIFGGTLSLAVAREIAIKLHARHAPLFALMLAMGMERPVVQPEFKWNIQGLQTRTTLIDNGGGHGSGDTTLNVDSSAIFAVNDTAFVESTNELMLVTGTPTATSITVTRAVGTQPAAAIADDATIINAGTAFPEGSSAPSDRVDGPTEYESYTQIFRKAVQLTGTVLRSSTVTEEERPRRRRVANFQLLEEMDHAALFGQKGKIPSGSSNNVQRFTQGVIDFANVNVADANGTLTKDELIDFLGQAFAYGSGRKFGFCSASVMSILTSLFVDSVRHTTTPDSVGLVLNHIDTAHGRLTLVNHRKMVGATYGNALAVVDIGTSAWRPLAGGSQDGRLQLKTDIQANDEDAIKDEWFAEGGFEWGDPDAHGLLTNITAAG